MVLLVAVGMVGVAFVVCVLVPHWNVVSRSPFVFLLAAAGEGGRRWFDVVGFLPVGYSWVWLVGLRRAGWELPCWSGCKLG